MVSAAIAALASMETMAIDWRMIAMVEDDLLWSLGQKWLGGAKIISMEFICAIRSLNE
jgi:hypothetical protein